MKQILSLALALLPCLAWAQYPSNGNQKITLGEQTTADGLVYRGLAADTTRKPSVDTMAYIILDTTTNLLWHYKKATSNKWLQAGGSTLDTATMLLPYYRSGRNTIIQASDVPTLNQNTTGSAATLTTSRTIQTNLASTSSASFNGSANITPGVTGTLPVANGGTGATSYLTGSIPYSNGSILTSDTSKIFFDATNSRIGIKTSVPSFPITINNNVSNGSIELNSFNNKFGRIFLNSFSNSTLHPGNIVSDQALYFQRWNTNDFNKDDQTSVVAGTGLGAIYFFGNAGTTRGQQYGGAITCDAIATGSTYLPANLRIFTNSATVDRSANPQIIIHNTGNVGIGIGSPTGFLHIKAGSTSTAPLKFTSGTNLTTAEAGAMEFNGTNLFFSPSTTRHTVNHGLTGSATLDFPSTTTLLSADLTITVTGAADGDVVSLGVPNAAVNANTCYTSWVSAANTVTVRFNNYSSGTVNPASGTFKVFVTK